MFKEFNFGSEYSNAHLSKIDQSEEIMNKLISWSTNPKHILYWCGKVGNGKTYFASAFYNHMKEKGKICRVYNEAALLSELKCCIDLQGWNPTYRLEIICESPYLILDDMGSSKMSDWAQEMLHYLIELRVINALPTLITSNMTKNDLKEVFHERFASRIFAAKNVIIETNIPDRRQDIYEPTTN